jgi:dihydrofolate reductase
MRKVTAGLFHSLDGVVEAPYKFQFDSFDDELWALMGRAGYQEWLGYWPNATTDLDFADLINVVPKFIASETLTAPLAWSHAELIEGDLTAFVRQLKGGEGGEIAVMGSISLVRQLLFAGLMDELTLITHPVVAAQGRHLFEPGDETTRLALVSTSQTSKGNVVSTYAPRP